MQITFTTQEAVSKKGGDKTLLVSYHQFPSMCVKGDTIFLGKYLVTGSEESSLYLTVSESNSTLMQFVGCHPCFEKLPTLFFVIDRGHHID